MQLVLLFYRLYLTITDMLIFLAKMQINNPIPNKSIKMIMINDNSKR